MRIKALVLFFVLLISCVAAAQGKSAEKKSSGAPDKAHMQKVLDAWSTMNTDEVGKYYDQAPGDVFYDVSPLKYNGWSEYAAGVKKLFDTLKSVKFTLNDDATVHHAGNLAWGTATVKMAMVDKGGKTSNLDCRWTALFEKKGANWVIVHDHYSTPLPEEPK
jgi:ketosteroid isomerase-like protein